MDASCLDASCLDATPEHTDEDTAVQTVSAILQAAQEFGTLLSDDNTTDHHQSSSLLTVDDSSRTQGHPHMLPSNHGNPTGATNCFEIQVEMIQEPSIHVNNSGIPVHTLPPPVRYVALNKTLAEKETQSMTWGQLTLEMLSDIVSQQVIQVSEIGGVSTTTMHGNPGCCYHMKGIRWKDVLDMIISSHNVGCQHTGVVFSRSTVQVGVVLEAGGTEQGMLSIYRGCTKTDVAVQTMPAVLPGEQKGKNDNVGDERNFKRKVEVSDAETQTVNLIDNDNNDVFCDKTQGKDSASGQTKADDNNDRGAEQEQSLSEQLRDGNDQTEHDLNDNESCNSNSNNGSSATNNDRSIPTVKRSKRISCKDKDLFNEIVTGTVHKQEITKATVVSKATSPSEDAITDEPDFLLDVPVKGMPAQCQVCKKRFRSRTLLKRHSVVHEENRNRHPCPHCEKVCKTDCYLQRHMATHFKSEKRVLRKKKGRPTRTNLTVPKTQGQPRAKKEKVPSQCGICQKTFTIARNLKRHMSIHSRNNTHPCPHCNKVCRSAHYLQLHLLVHAEEKQYKCNDCKASFGAMHKLKQHRTKEHNISEQHQCPVCGVVYKHKVTLEDHMLGHSDGAKSSYLCPHCGKTFNRPSVYRLHVAYHASRAKPDAHPCDHCTKSYATRGLLNKHVRSAHLKERNHKCAVCNMGFFTKQQCVTHEQVHSDTPAHVCNFCGKGFAQKHTLIAHRRLHSGYRPFPCQHCGKGFTSKAHKDKHEKIHSATQLPPKRPFKCKVCDSAFSNRTACADHEKRHAGIKDHKCEFCFVAFVTRGDLVRHLKTHTSGKPFRCRHCNMGFGKKLELTEHEASHAVVEVPITVTLLPLQQ